MFQQELVSAKYLPGYESTWEVATTTATDPPSSDDEARYAKTLILFAIFVTAAIASFYPLPYVQALLIPQASGGTDGPWVIHPNLGAHVFGCLFIGAMTAVVASVGLGEGWKDGWDEQGTTTLQPPGSSPWTSFAKLIVYIWFGKLILIFGIFLTLYLYSWCAITVDGIQVRTPLGARNYSFAHVRALRLEPRGHLPFADKDDQYGYTLEFLDGRTYYFNLKNEGLSKTEMTAIASFLSEKTGKPWRNTPASDGRQQYRR